MKSPENNQFKKIRILGATLGLLALSAVVDHPSAKAQTAPVTPVTPVISPNIFPVRPAEVTPVIFPIPNVVVPTPTPQEAPIFGPSPRIKATPLPDSVITMENCPGVIVPASWYDLHGEPTASGEIMDREASTVAIPQFEFRRFREKLGDWIKITVLGTNRSEKLRANDTGLMGQGRYKDKYLDITRGAAYRLGIIDAGVVPVCAEFNQ